MRKKLKIDHAESLDNGIIFFSKRHKKHISIATIDGQGNISSKWCTIKEYQNSQNSQKRKSKSEKLCEFKRLFLASLAISPLILSLIKFLNLEAEPIYNLRILFMGIPIIFLSCFMLICHLVRKTDERLFRFHSAEHMVINAYEKLNRVPSLDEIHEYSRFNNGCGTNFITLLILLFILGFAHSFIPVSLYFVISYLVSSVIALILLQCGFLNFLQYFTTSTPTDTELLVAISGMQVWFENEIKKE